MGLQESTDSSYMEVFVLEGYPEIYPSRNHNRNHRSRSGRDRVPHEAAGYAYVFVGPINPRCYSGREHHVQLLRPRT